MLATPPLPHDRSSAPGLAHTRPMISVSWSYDLLSSDEQRLLRRLSVFAGGFTLEAAEIICDEKNEGNVPGSLTNLVHKSLVVADLVPGQETRSSYTR